MLTLQEDGVEDRCQPDASLSQHHFDHLVIANLPKIFRSVEFDDGIPRIPVRRPRVSAVDGMNLFCPGVRTCREVLILVERDLSGSESGKLDGLGIKTLYGGIRNVNQILGKPHNGSGETTLDPVKGSCPFAGRIVRVRIAAGRTFEPFAGRRITPPTPDSLGDDEPDVGIKDGADEGRFELSAGERSAMFG